MNIGSFAKKEYNDEWKIDYANMKFFNKYIEPIDVKAYAKDIDKANRLKKCNIKKLYKYSKFYNDYFDNEYKKYQVLMKNPNNFNDPFDSVFSYFFSKGQLIEALINYSGGIDNFMSLLSLDKENEYVKIKTELQEKINLGHFDAVIDEAVDKTIQASIEDLRNKTWVSCFSEINNSMLMWSHYADCHKGVCLEYDFSDEDSVAFNILNPVLYVDKIYNMKEHYFNNSGFDLCTILKSIEWKYEKEWRLVIPNLVNAKEEIVDVYPPTAIYLGALMEKTDREIIINFAERNKIDIYEMKLSSIEYKLIPSKLKYKC